MSTCERCNHTLYYSERKYGQQFCRLCAGELGLTRICDAPRPRTFRMSTTEDLAADAAALYSATCETWGGVPLTFSSFVPVKGAELTVENLEALQEHYRHSLRDVRLPHCPFCPR